MSAETGAHQGLLWYSRRAGFLLVTKVRGHIEHVSTKPNINSSSHLREPATIGADGDNESGRAQQGQMLNISERVWSSLRCSVTPSSLVRVRLSVNIALHQLNIKGKQKLCKCEHNTKTVFSLDKSLTVMLDIFAEQTHTVNVLVLDFLAEVSIYYSEFFTQDNPEGQFCIYSTQYIDRAAQCWRPFQWSLELKPLVCVLLKTARTVDFPLGLILSTSANSTIQ